MQTDLPIDGMWRPGAEGTRFDVQEGIAARFTEAFTERMAALRLGDGTGPGVDFGPLVNADTRDRVAGFAEGTVQRAATLRIGGRAPEGRGFHDPPTVMTDCVADEILGPVAAIRTFRAEDEVLRRANATEYGLAAHVFTGDMTKGLRVCERLDYGMAGLDRGLVSDPAAPFGGTRQSGLGRGGGHEGILEFMETRYIPAGW